jgi:FlaA1/EpsC-like NDP-sugar epimerase
MRFLRNRYLLGFDIVLLAMVPPLLYALRFESFHLPVADATTARWFTLTATPTYILVLFVFGMYQRLWRYASIGELRRIVVAGVTASALCWLLGLAVLPLMHVVQSRVPLSVLFTYALLTTAVVTAPRMALRMSAAARARRRWTDADRRVLIAGAGTAGEMVLRELRRNHDVGLVPVGFVDDDASKWGLHLSDLPIFGSLDRIPQIVESEGVQEILIAMPRAPGAVVRRVVKLGFDAGVKTRTIPALFDILAQRVSVASIREVEIEDLLRRDAVQTDLAAISALVANGTVLVTGAGGSIGSELCRQLLALNPARLVLLGHGENPIFGILNELRGFSNGPELCPVIADVRDRDRLFRIFEEYKPRAVFHAAAHKHVPLMELNACEAITNNVMGTRNLVDAAVQFGTEHFVLISTDKAVRPANVMGASKRLAEHVVHNAAVRHGRNFVAVRFGNVLGSQGSVVPTFVRQIKAGGPVTVTDPEMRRYFMTIPEAVQLVLQAGALGKGGELFMLDMGEPVKIVDLARDMIRLSGLEVGEDIEIEFTGIRPGEKLYEEMFFSHEVAEPTHHPKILRARNGHTTLFDEASIQRLIDAARAGADQSVLRSMLGQLLPDFTNGEQPEDSPAAAPSDRAASRQSGPDSLARRTSGAAPKPQRA